MHLSKYPKPLFLFSYTPEDMIHQILQREMHKTLIFSLVFGIKRPWQLVKHLSTQSDGMGFESNKGHILHWLRGRIVSPSAVGIILHAQIELVTKVTFILLIELN